MMRLRPMTQKEFEVYLNEAIHNYAAERVKAGNWSEDEAVEKATQEYKELLPDGEKTKEHYLFSIIDHEQYIGMIWLHKKTDKVGFIHEISVLDKYRKHGYGTYALQTLEVFAKKLGLNKLELHVFNNNTTAIKLYEQLDYKTTNRLMAKDI